MNKKWLMALSASLLLISCSGTTPASSETSSSSSSEQTSSTQESSSAEASSQSSSESSSEASSESSSEELVGDDYFALSEDKAYFTLIKCPDPFASDYTVPSTYKGLPVKAIAKTAFSNALLISKLSIPSSVEFIEKGTLGYICSTLSTLTTPFVGQSADESGAYLGEMFGIGDVTGKNMTSYYASGFKSLTITNQSKLPDGVLSGCDTLESLVVENCEELGNSSLASLIKLSSLTLPDGLLKIGKGALGHNTALTSLSIPDSVTTIEGQAFVELPFETFTLPKSLESFKYYQDMPNLKEWAISSENEHFKVVDGVLYSKDETGLINFPQAKDASSFALPETVTTIGEYAFFSTNVTSLDFTGVQSIGNYAFYTCTSLKEAHFGSGLSYVGRAAFSSSGISQLDFATTLDAGVNFETSNMSFASCYKLENVSLPSYITSIQDSWFASCSKLSSLTVAGSLTYVGINALSGTSVTALELTFANEAEIKYGVFSESSINELTLHFDEDVTVYPVIPSSGIGATPSIVVDNEDVAAALKQAWSNCPNLAALISTKDAIPQEFVVEDGVLVRYDVTKAEDPSRIIIPDTVTTIAKNVFVSLTEVQYVYIPSSVTTIEVDAFKTNPNILEIEFGHDDPTVLANGSSFYRQIGASTNIHTVYTIKDPTKTDAFIKMFSMYKPQVVTTPEEVTIDYTRKEIYNADKTIIYGYCGSDESYTFIDSVTEVGASAFKQNKTIKTVDWNNVEKIGESAFTKCVLSEVVLGEKVTSIGNSAFSYSKGLESISIQGAADVGNSAFYGSEDESPYTVTSLDLGNSLKSIGDGAFSYILSEVEVFIPATCTSVDPCAFDYFSDSEDSSIYFAASLSTYRSEENSYWDEDDYWLDDFLCAAWDNNEVVVAFYSESTPSEEEQGFDCSYWHYDESGAKTLY